MPMEIRAKLVRVDALPAIRKNCFSRRSYVDLVNEFLGSDMELAEITNLNRTGLHGVHNCARAVNNVIKAEGLEDRVRCVTRCKRPYMVRLHAKK